MRREAATAITKTVPVATGSENVARAGFPSPVFGVHLGARAQKNQESDHVGVGIGLSIGGNGQRLFTLSAEDGAANSGTASRNDAVIGAGDQSNSANLLYESALTGLTEGGIATDFSNVGTQGDYVSTLFQEGVAQAELVDATINGTGTTDITTTFQPDAIVCFGNPSAMGGSSNNASMAVSFYGNSSYASVAAADEHGASPSNSDSYSTSTAMIAELDYVASTPTLQTFTVGSITDTGFTCTKVAGTADASVTFLCLKLMGGYSLRVGFAPTPTYLSPHQRLDTLFPDNEYHASVLFAGATTALETVEDDMRFMLGTVAPDGTQSCLSLSAESGVATPNTKSGVYNDRAVHLMNPSDSAATVSASFESHSAFSRGTVLTFSRARDPMQLGCLFIGRDKTGRVGGGHAGTKVMDARTIADKYSQGRPKVAEYEFRHRNFYQGGDDDG